MTRLTLALAALVLFASQPALACDDVCKADEYYSDEAEMCVVVPLA